jgi:hypothetical protein
MAEPAAETLDLSIILVAVSVVLAAAAALFMRKAAGAEEFSKVKNASFAPSIKKVFSEDLSNNKEGFERVL